MLANRKKIFRLNESKIVKVHDFLYSRHKYAIMLSALILYVAVVILWGNRLGISSNYFIIAPLIVIAVSSGFTGGLLAGILALPSNLLLFHLIEHPEFAPESLLIAEISGILVGSVLGYISDFFTMMKREMKRRKESEEALEKSVREKEILLNEINHRVKNNLNLIKSLIQLQTNRVTSASRKRELEKLSHRIISIAMVQDLLFSQNSIDILDFRLYLKQLLKNLLSGYDVKNILFELDLSDEEILLDSKRITSLGLIVNEIITNAVKYAFKNNEHPELTVSLIREKGFFHLSVKDNGPGYPDKPDGPGLGFKLIKTLSSNLDGNYVLQNNKGGRITLTIPVSGNFDESY